VGPTAFGLDRQGPQEYTCFVCSHPSGKFLLPTARNPIGRPIGLLIGSALISLLLIETGHAESREDAKLGKVIYIKNCIACHGQKGDGLGSRSSLPNFTDAKTMAAKTNQELFNKISNGGKGTGMPAYNKVLTEQDRWYVLAYIRTLSTP
jgi:mono/diheme cytochrome c family protein